jgi:alkylresorcinol/alkylpyrone synthase
MYIASIATATPDLTVTQQEAWRFVEKHYAGRLSRRSLALMRKMLAHPSIRKRSFAFADPSVLIDEDPDRRMERFTRWAVRLAGEAAKGALDRAGLTAADVSAVTVNTCSGYVCPGISTYLIEALGLPKNTEVYDLVGSGCGGAIPNLKVSEMLAREKVGRSPVLSIAVEVCSATYQMDDDMGLLLSNVLFGDGAAAAVICGKPLGGRPEGLEIVAFRSLYAPEHRDEIRYVYKGGQLHNRLSMELPGIVGRTAGGLVREMLRAESLDARDIGHWALHPGGEKIINAVRDEVGIPEERLSASRRVLAEYGNMSSPTVLFVLKDILGSGCARPGDLCLLLAFGAGLSAHACLLRVVKSGVRDALTIRAALL